MAFYDELHEATAEGQAYVRSAPIIATAMAGRATRAQYLAFLTQAYYHVRHTTPLLMACGARIPAHMEWLREAVAHYIEEEIGHQEWILNDIRVIGGDVEAVRHGQCAIETELMVSYAYDTVMRGNPVGFFGMVFVLEGTSVHLATQAATVLQSSLDLPSSAFSYLSSHGSLDMTHIEDFRGVVNRLENADDRAAVLHCAKVFFRLYGDVIRTIPQGEKA
ncbi:TenA family transcriptional regulator [Uliginosibacterium gangwonense]|uniref:TenA family transcriptional regulator n=1 Tax=Uliginosibacterium gangwonense TaxID=392736 RepID=UPI0003821EF7|nr:iron-containing redox enzyme family protein [Uliginosibacterium gangwonense]